MSKLFGIVLTTITAVSHTMADDVDDLIRELNATSAAQGTDDIKSWREVFGTILDAPQSPMDIGATFNMSTVWPGMEGWSEVSDWAESNPDLFEAILAARGRATLGLPYGDMSEADEAFVEAGILAQPAPGGDPMKTEFPWIDKLNWVTTCVSAEAWRRAEAGDVMSGIDLQTALVQWLRQCCTREFIDEQYNAINSMSVALQVTREIAWWKRNEVDPDGLKNIARTILPQLKVDRNNLLMAEGDKELAKVRLDRLFSRRGQPDAKAFLEFFTDRDADAKSFGRVRNAGYWRWVARQHKPEELTAQKLDDVYDDWWRRWRIQAYDPILSAQPPESERMNSTRYAAVLKIVPEIRPLFEARNRLLVEVNGTCAALAVCAQYKKDGRWPADIRSARSNTRRLSVVDPFSIESKVIKYWKPNRLRINGHRGEVVIDSGLPVIYSLGVDTLDGDAKTHTDNGIEGDIVVWPPLRMLEREQDLRD